LESADRDMDLLNGISPQRGGGCKHLASQTSFERWMASTSAG
jgi:hypothetical protein